MCPNPDNLFILVSMPTGSFNRIQIKWLVDPDVDETCLDIPANLTALHAECPYPADLGRGWVDRLVVSDEIVIYQSAHRFSNAGPAQMLPLGEFNLAFSEVSLCVHTLHCGSAVCRELLTQTDLAMQPGSDLFRFAQQGQFIPMLSTATDITMTALVVTERALQDSIGEDATAQLLSTLGLMEPPVAKIVQIPLQVTEPLRQSLASGSTGNMHTLFAQSKVLEYLWRLATYVTDGKSVAAKQTAAVVETVRALHDYLMQLEGSMPTLSELAKKFGESPQTLNKVFAREFGQSIYAMVNSHRLNQAHQALVEGSLPIKTIASRLGYSHVNHFSHAFKVRFGCTPGSLRRTA